MFAGLQMQGFVYIGEVKRLQSDSPETMSQTEIADILYSQIHFCNP